MKLLNWLNDPEDTEFVEPEKEIELSPALKERLDELHHVPVVSIMIPRPLIKALDADIQLRRQKRLKSSKARYFPVYKGDLDHTLGWIEKAQVLEILNMGLDDARIEHHVQPMAKVLDTAAVSDLADLFLKTRSPLVLVINSHGQCVGLVTLTDFVEHLFGFDVESAKPVITPEPPVALKPYEI